MAKTRATELEFLKFFYVNVDFGPADADVQDGIKQDFLEQSGKSLPKGYEIE